MERPKIALRRISQVRNLEPGLPDVEQILGIQEEPNVPERLLDHKAVEPVTWCDGPVWIAR